MSQTDLELIEALYYGTHLEKEELAKAKDILKQLELNARFRQ
jgi:hypothetical protein